MVAGTTTTPRLESLTGMRGVAAMLVVAFHFGAIYQIFDGPTRTVGEPGNTGVAFFFMLSGFVLAWSARPTGLPRFYGRRLARIWPLYVVIGVISMIRNAATDIDDPFDIVVRVFAMIQAWWPDDEVYFGVEIVFWSLSCEFFFYLAFPFLYRFISTASPGMRRGAIAAMVLAIFVIAIIGRDYPDDNAFWFLYIFPPVRFLEFAIGAMLALELKEHGLPAVPVWPAIAFGTIVYFTITQFPASAQPIAVMLIPWMLIIVALAQADIREPGGPFASKPMVALGRWSYALYLVHSFVLWAWQYITQNSGIPVPDEQGDAMQVVMLIILAAASVVAAAVAYRVIERPAERVARRWVDANTAS